MFCFDLYALQFLPEPVTSTITAETIVCLNTDAANATYGYHEGEGGGGGRVCSHMLQKHTYGGGWGSGLSRGLRRLSSIVPGEGGGRLAERVCLRRGCPSTLMSYTT